MTRKRERQQAIRQLIGARPIASQEELKQAVEPASILIGARPIASQEELKQVLALQGWQVTQATLSRDLHDLGVVRAPTDTGVRYLLPEMVADDAKPSLERLLPQLFSSIDGVSELIVLRTR